MNTTGNRRTSLRLTLLSAAMFAFGFALVPLYDVFCDLTGLNRDAAQALANNTQVDASRSVRIELVANVQDGALWRFAAPRLPVEVHPGELVRVEYELENLSDRPLVGRAVPSYAPLAAAAHFKKIDCFCFREQHLAPHEKVRLPVLFVLDRGVARDMKVVTLSYTFFALGKRT
ncbi:MAG: cytochrome c oxidase assembly protein [Hydrogenophilales bacterium CG17_big_fil_post_rev_8_21_14_2_50_63_12]|nr:MAG: cytochrome c oxidase assembly protein [Hydrogenophilales bacterium CG17_big_fil_post_rev_8_21_14_2_50_63_12]PIX96463.1 MAG: cytochrome c oxidase assembly protein [Hydrogenophilales bacterium CG_4_10_14_3_um_filter_63_21]